MNNVILRIAALLTIVASGSVAAQTSPDIANFNNAVEEARTLIQTERKMLVSENMALTNDEAAKFWPLYDKYAAELKEVGNMRVKVITDYASAYNSNSLTDIQAKQLLEDSLKYQKKALSVKESYMGKFRKVLGNVKLARFYQLENKLDAITNFALAREIPLVPLQQ